MIVLQSYFISGHSKTIGEFDYIDGDINDIIMSCMSNISIVGVVGSLSFEGDADPISNVQIERIQGSDHITNYHRMSNYGHSATILSSI